MDERRQDLADGVAITSIEVGFWNLVTFCIKWLGAMVLAASIIGAVLSLPILVIAILIDVLDI